MTQLSLNGSALSASVDIDSPYAPRGIIPRNHEVYRDAYSGPGGPCALDWERGRRRSYRGEMEAALSPPPTTTITPPEVDTAITLDTSGAVAPVFDHGALVESSERDLYSPHARNRPHGRCRFLRDYTSGRHNLVDDLG